MILEKETLLFDKWANKRQNFSKDGIVDESLYVKSTPRVMLILKEVNSQNGESIDLKEFLKNGAYNRSQTWDNVVRWIYGIRNLNRDLSWSDLGCKEGKRDEVFLSNIKNELLPTICVINVNKSPGIHTSNNDKVWKEADQDKEFLNHQFQLYYQNINTRPDIIICGGTSTSNIFNEIVDIPNKENWRTTSRGIWYYEFEKGKFFICYSHPEARVQDSLIYYGLIDAIKELRLKK